MAKKPEHFWIEPNKLSEKGIDFCTLAAQGLWLKMMRLLHASERYGYLSRDGKAVPDEQIARRCGIAFQEWSPLAAELFEFDLLKRSNDGIIYSPELVTQAEWRAANAKRQKTFQDKKRGDQGEIVNENSNTSYNGYITPDVTPDSHVTLNSKTTLSSNEEKSGGGGQTAAAVFPPNVQGETGQSYLERKQIEYPLLNVRAVYSDFASKCGSEKYPHLKNNRRQFDIWLENEEVPLSIPSEGKSVVPGIGEVK